MKCRPALFVCGIVLFAALPVCAERIPYTVSASGSQNFDTSSDLAAKYNFAAKTPVDAEFQTVATSTVKLTGIVDANPIIDNWGVDSLLASTSVLPSSSDIQLASLVGHPEFGTASSDLSGRVGLWEETGGDKHAIIAPAGHFDKHPQHHENQQVPEPGSLPLVLIGLVAISFLAIRRAPLARNS
jgi:hypothetical protein